MTFALYHNFKFLNITEFTCNIIIVRILADYSIRFHVLNIIFGCTLFDIQHLTQQF